MALLAALLPAPAQATSLTVPDDVATIQAALDAGPDTVLVRAGVHDETPIASDGVVLLGLGGGGIDRPAVSGMWYVADHSDRPDLLIQGLTFTGPMRIVSPGGGATMTFRNCHFLGGIRDASPDPTASVMTLRHCRIVGDAVLGTEGFCFVDSCTIEGGSLAIPHSYADAFVRDCEIRGSGTGTAISVQRGASAEILRNVISGYSMGIFVEAEQVVRIEDNLIRDCSWTAIYLWAGGSVNGNRVERCGGDYAVYLPGSYEPMTVMNNTISHSTGTGLFVGTEQDTRIVGNVTYANGRDGIDVRGYADGSFEFRNNTSAMNRGSGYLFWTGVSPTPYSLTRNVGYGNERHGIEWISGDHPVMGCNAWYSNTLGDVVGPGLSSQDIFVDPLLCDPASGDLRPSATSPIATRSECGPIGALGVGCYAPGMLYAAFHLTRVGPSPSGGRVNIEFEMPRAAAIEVEVFDILGRRVATPARGTWPAGRHSVAWMQGEAGVYLVRFRFPGGQEHRRIVRTP